MAMPVTAVLTFDARGGADLAGKRSLVNGMLAAEKSRRSTHRD
jgi:hypothetical protein